MIVAPAKTLYLVDPILSCSEALQKCQIHRREAPSRDAAAHTNLEHEKRSGRMNHDEENRCDGLGR